MLKTLAQSDGSSAVQRVEKSSEADSEVGSAFGPGMPALFTMKRGFDERERGKGMERKGIIPSRLMCFSFFEISSTSFSRSFLDVTSQGPTLIR